MTVIYCKSFTFFQVRWATRGKYNTAPAHSLINTLRRIFFCQFCHLPHQVNGSVVIFTDAQKLQHLLNNDCDILGVSDPKEQLQRLQEKNFFFNMMV